MAEQLSLDLLKKAIEGSAAAFRCRTTLQPAGGEGDKVFPPTYAGAVYATEKRRLPGRDEPVECVLLDSVQSQANRMEEALQEAVDEGRLKIPVIVVDFSNEALPSPIGKVTSLQAPHRIADAILRDSLIDGIPFRETEFGKKVNDVCLANATPLFELCPTALVFGMWDSTGPKGGSGAKFQRAMVSEMIGIDAVYGVKTISRIDPLQIRAAVKVIKGDKGEWSIADDPKMKGAIPPSEVNHSNIPPAFSKYPKGAKGPDILKRQDANYYDSSISDYQAHEKEIAPGGVTIAYVEQTLVFSMPALRRLHFPVQNIINEKPEEKNKRQRKYNHAGHVVLAALGLCAATLAAEKGFDLRSRCLLWPAAPMEWDLLDRPGQQPTRIRLDADAAIALLQEAVAAAETLGFKWRAEPLMLKPAPQLVELVRKSQELSAAQVSEEGDA